MIRSLAESNKKKSIIWPVAESNLKKCLIRAKFLSESYRYRGVIWAIWRMKSGTDHIKTLKKIDFINVFQNNCYSDRLNWVYIYLVINLSMLY